MPGRARAALLGACALWAVSFVATKVALRSTPALAVVALRLAISAACFAAWLGVVGWGRRRKARVWLELAGLSLLGTGLHYGIQTVGLQYTTAANASLYAITGPVTIALLGWALLGERLSRRKVAGIATAALGVLAVLGGDTLARADLGRRVLGDLLVLVSIVLWGAFTVFGKRLTDELGALRTIAAVTIVGALWTAPAGWWAMAARGISPADLPLAAWAAIAFLGVGCSFLATLLYFVGLELSESQKVGVYLYTIPPMTAAVSVAFLGERLTPGLVAGSALVFAGVALTERG